MGYRRLLVVGLDCASPKLLYEDFIEELPNFQKIIGDGSRFLMRSSHPPITIPAWAVMVTGKTPGELGIYGFRHRKPGVYEDFYIVNSKYVRAETIWDRLGREGLRSIVVGVPPSYPPKIIKGLMVSDFITPSADVTYTFPPSLKAELESRFGKYTFDVAFRTMDREKIIRDLWAMTEQHFRVLEYLASNKRWDFMMFVEIGVDRVHHAFWGYMDKNHHKYVPGNRYENVIRDYYRLVDEKLGRLLKNVPEDTVVMVVSDHGAKGMKGAFAVNQWLAQEGFLKIEDGDIKPGTDLRDVKVDWSRTVAWGWGGYYARIFLNVKGREPEGVVEKDDYEYYRDLLADEIKKIRGPNGERWETKVYRPEELYPEVNGDPPDLMVYFDDLNWRSAGTLGWGTNYLLENDRGPDDAVHDWLGVLSVYDPQGTFSDSRDVYSILEVRRLMEGLMGVSGDAE